MVLLEDNIQDVMNSYKKRIEVSSTSSPSSSHHRKSRFFAWALIQHP